MWMYVSLAPFCMGDGTAWRWRIIKQKSFSSSVEKLFFSPMQGEREREKPIFLLLPTTPCASSFHHPLLNGEQDRCQAKAGIHRKELRSPPSQRRWHLQLHYRWAAPYTTHRYYTGRWMAKSISEKTLFTIFYYFCPIVPSSKPSKTSCAHDGARK